MFLPLPHQLKYHPKLFLFSRRAHALRLLNPLQPKSSLASIIAIQKILPHTMILPQYLIELVQVVQLISANNTPGDIVECGVWKGGSAALTAWASKYYHSNKTLHLYDSFAGFPQPSSQDQQGPGKKFTQGRNPAQTQQVHAAFKALNLPHSQYHIHPGFFNSTLFKQPPHPKNIALLHVDCDLYKSHLECLNSLYHQVSPGGFVIFNDYGYLPGATQAVKYFFRKNHISAQLPSENSLRPFIHQKASSIHT
jgi:O-methyltransferase